MLRWFVDSPRHCQYQLILIQTAVASFGQQTGYKNVSVVFQAGSLRSLSALWFLQQRTLEAVRPSQPSGCHFFFLAIVVIHVDHGAFAKHDRVEEKYK